MDIATLITQCPAPVANASGVTSALEWLALSAAFADENIGKDAHNYLPIKTDAYIYFNDIVDGSTEYASINNQLYHVKDMLKAIQTLST